MRRIFVFLLFLSLILGQVQTARAEAVQEQRSRGYWVGNLSATGVLVLGGLGATLIDAEPFEDHFWFGPDESVTRHHSTSAAMVSDVSLLSLAIGPLLFVGLETGRREFANASLVYTQAHAMNFAVTALVKYSVRRPRPFTYRLPLNPDQQPNCDHSSDSCLSFYSGHSSTSFTSALAGGYLINETLSPSLAYRALNWGVLMMGAAATAHLRVRAGKHFYSDIVVGTLVGTSIGVLVPIAHGGQYRPRAVEVGSALSGLALGTALPLLFPSTDPVVRDARLSPYFIPGHGAGLRFEGDL